MTAPPSAGRSSDWGESSLEYDVFAGFPSQGSVGPVNEFKRLTLRSGSHDTGQWWTDPLRGWEMFGSWIRNRWGDETMLELGHVNPHGRWVNVFLNGNYWGQYHLREHFDDHFMASYFGGDNSDYMGVNSGAVSNGSGEGWAALAASSNSWNSWKLWVDPVAYVDFMIINEFQGNFWDLWEKQNWRGAGPSSGQNPGPGWQFFGSDQDMTFPLADRATRFIDGPAKSWERLRAEAHPDFVALVNDRVNVLLRGDGVLTTDSAIDRWRRMASVIEQSMHAEVARWGNDFFTAKTWSEWRDNLATLESTIIAERTAFTLERFADYGLIADVEAPVLSGCCSVPAGSNVSIETADGVGTIVYTIDGSDPRLDGGATSATAISVDNVTSASVTINEATTITARVRRAGEWSAVRSWDIFLDGATAPLILNEWNAVSGSGLLTGGDPAWGQIPGNGGDWFELVVVEDHLDVRGWTMDLATGGSVRDTLAFGADPLLGDLRSGTIITIAEDHAEDVSYDPARNDWHVNLRAASNGSGTYVSAENFVVDENDWQITIRNANGLPMFGPAGEGVSPSSGVTDSEIGELEAHPSAAVTPSSPYDDGNSSTFGAPNEFDGGMQDFSDLRSVVAPVGDVDCSGDLSIVDALMIAQFDVGNRVDTTCPLGEPAVEIEAETGDINNDGRTDIIDALIVSQCVVGIDNGSCPMP